MGMTNDILRDIRHLDPKMEQDFYAYWNAKDGGNWVLNRLKAGHETFKHGPGLNVAMKVAGVGLGAALTAYGMGHVFQGFSDRPKANVTHEGTSWEQIFFGGVAVITGMTLATVAYTSPAARAGTQEASRLMEEVLAMSKQAAR